MLTTPEDCRLSEDSLSSDKLQSSVAFDMRLTKIVCVGRNYVEHAKELGNEVPTEPLIFLKPPSSVIGDQQPIRLPDQSKQVEFEGEIGIIVGERLSNASEELAREAVLAITAVNDVTARDLQRSDSQWTRAKGFDTFCPFGPWIDTEFDPADSVVTCRVNGQMRQMASTRDMVFNVGVLISYISSVMTLDSGDLIFTGTPSGVGQLKDGDEVSVEIEGLGEIKNKVKSEGR